MTSLKCHVKTQRICSPSKIAISYRFIDWNLQPLVTYHSFNITRVKWKAVDPWSQTAPNNNIMHLLHLKKKIVSSLTATVGRMRMHLNATISAITWLVSNGPWVNGRVMMTLQLPWVMCLCCLCPGSCHTWDLCHVCDGSWVHACVCMIYVTYWLIALIYDGFRYLRN